MRVRSIVCVLLALLFVLSCVAASAAIDKAVFRDTKYKLGWANATVSDRITNYLKGKGYRVVDAAGLRTFMETHIAARDTSVVVMANDIPPDTVMDPINGQPNPNSTLIKYLKAGGKAVFLFDWPAYNVGTPDGKATTWNDVGARAAFGFWVAQWGKDGRGNVTFTDEGAKWGLTKVWASQRATGPENVDLVLGYAPGGAKDAVMPWVKNYVIGRPGAGMVYMYDRPAGDLVNAGFNDDDIAQIDRVASYFPEGETRLVGANLTVTVQDPTGKPYSGALVTISNGSQSSTFPSAADGTVSIFVAPGTYQITTIPSSSYEPGPAVWVPVQDKDVAATVTVTPLPYISLASADKIATWKATNTGSATDNTPADPAFDDSKWDNVTAPGDLTKAAVDPNPVGTNTYFWYRAHFTIPADFAAAAQGKPLLLYQYNIDDSDWTYLNGHLLGAMENLWNTERRYTVDPSWVNWNGDNVLAIKGYQGGGGAGMNSVTGGPRLRVAASSRGYIATTVTVPGLPAGVQASYVGFQAAIADGSGRVFSGILDSANRVRFNDVPPGPYVLSVTGRTVATQTTVSVQVSGAQTATPDALSFTYIPILVQKPDPKLSDDFNAGTLDPKWTSADIGNPLAGNTKVDNGQLVITADGSDIWDGGDHFRYVYEPVSGDVAASVAVINVPDTDNWSKAGIMIRQSTDPNAMHQLVAATRNNGLALQGRVKPDPAGNSDVNVNTSSFTQGQPYYLRLVRKGNHFTAYRSPDGIRVSLLGENDLDPSFPKDALIGLAATSHNGTKVGDARFDDFRVSTDPSDVNVETGGGSVATPPAPVIAGDLNGDGSVSIADVVIELRVVVGLAKPTTAQLAAGDLNKNGVIDLADAVALLRAAIGLVKL